MTSKAFFKKHVELLRRFSHGNRHVEVWETSCIVTNFHTRARQRLLINPANPELSGVRNFPYFPKGGPVPERNVETMHKDWQPLGHVSSWGSMDTSRGILFPISVVDGLVHQLGGWRLRVECDWVSWKLPACPVGTSVLTSPGGADLRQYYDGIIHTATPFADRDHNATSEDPEALLRSCYRDSLRLAQNHVNANVPSSAGLPNKRRERMIDAESAAAARQAGVVIACPLLGAGAKGFTETTAMQVAVEESMDWMLASSDRNANSGLSSHPSSEMPGDVTVAFGLLDGGWAQEMVTCMDERIGQSTESSMDLDGDVAFSC